MKRTILKFTTYKVFGLTFRSEVELPELTEVESQKPDVVINLGEVPDYLYNMLNNNMLYQVRKNDFLLNIAAVGKYRVQNGRTITVEPERNANAQEIRLFLLGSAMGALLHQRKTITLHGSGVVKDNQGIVFIGKSSAGKSTIAAGLLSNGYSVITDDIAVIRFHGKNPYILPGIPHLKLWKDVLNHLKDKSYFERVKPKVEKYKMPIKPIESSKSVLLDKIIFISQNSHHGFRFEEVLGADKFNLLISNTYRIQYVEKIGGFETHFKNISKLASKIRIYMIERPISPLEIKKFANFVDDNIIRLG